MPIVPHEQCRMKGLCSGIRHLKEITEAGFEAPAVNQIQVRQLMIFPGYLLSTHSPGSASSVLPTERDRRLLSKERDYCTGIQSTHPSSEGAIRPSGHHGRSGQTWKR